MLNHDDIRHKLSDYIDGAVSDGERTEIEAHLTTCAECSDALAQLRKAIEYVKETEEVESPAWMTGKIMARVRAKAEEEKSVFRRLFYPLAVRLPIQTVAVLFLAVTAYYLYQNINPAEKYAETPMEVAAKKSAPAEVGTAREEKAAQPRAKEVGQGPGYKSLDMKYEYEKPAPPAPLGEAAAPSFDPSPAKPEARPQLRDDALGRGGLADAPAAEPSEDADKLETESSQALRQERAEPSAGLPAEKKAKSAAPAPQMRTMAAVEGRKKIRVSLSAPHAAKAAQDIETIVKQLGGAMIRKSGEAEAPVLTISLDSGKMRDLKDKLKKVGELKDEEMPLSDYRGILQVEIMISPTGRL